MTTQTRPIIRKAISLLTDLRKEELASSQQAEAENYDSAREHLDNAHNYLEKIRKLRDRNGETPKTYQDLNLQITRAEEIHDMSWRNFFEAKTGMNT